MFLGFNGCAPSSVVGMIEIIVNYELRTQPGNAMNAMAMPTPPANRALIDKASDTLAASPAIVTGTKAEEYSQFFEKHVESMLRSGLQHIPGGAFAVDLYDLVKPRKR